MDTKPTKLSVSLRKPYRHSHHESNELLKDSTNPSALLQPRLQHFSKPVSLPEQEKTGKGVVAVNTNESSQWALRYFNEWAGNNCSLAPYDPMPMDLLASHDGDLVCKWLCLFLMETKRTDGSLYLLSLLRSLVCGINHILQSNQAPFSVVDKCDSQFSPLLKTLDSLSSELHHSGVGVAKNSAKVIEVERENCSGKKACWGFRHQKFYSAQCSFM